MSEHQSNEADQLEGITTALYELDGALSGIRQQLAECEHERTAATILAALTLQDSNTEKGRIEQAVRLTDALRAELAGK